MDILFEIGFETICLITASLCGILSRILLGGFYVGLITAAKSMKTTILPAAKHMKEQYLRRHQEKLPITNTEAFLHRCLEKETLCGIPVRTLENLYGQVLIFNLLFTVTIWLYALIQGIAEEVLTRLLFQGVFLTAVLVLTDRITLVHGKKETAFLVLTDYFDNYLATRLLQQEKVLQTPMSAAEEIANEKGYCKALQNKKEQEYQESRMQRARAAEEEKRRRKKAEREQKCIRQREYVERQEQKRLEKQKKRNRTAFREGVLVNLSTEYKDTKRTVPDVQAVNKPQTAVTVSKEQLLVDSVLKEFLS